MEDHTIEGLAIHLPKSRVHQPSSVELPAIVRLRRYDNLKIRSRSTTSEERDHIRHELKQLRLAIL